MARGLVISLVLHLGLLAWALVGFAGTKPFEVEDVEAVEVSIVSIPDTVTRQKQGDVNSKIEEAAASSVPSPVPAAVETPKPVPPPPAAAPPPPPPEAAPEPPKPEPPPPPPAAEAPPPPAPKAPEPDPIAVAIAEEEARRTAEAEAKAKAEAEAKAKAEAAAKAKAKAIAAAKAKALAKAKADAARKDAEAKAKLAAKAPSFDDLVAKSIEGATEKPELLDKDPRKKAGGGQPSPVPTSASAKGPTAGSPTGRDAVNTARDEDMLRALIRQALASCWRLPTAGGDSRAIPVVKLSWRMRPDGSLDGEPRVVAREESPIGVVAADAAVRAVQSCRFGLPADKYALWREIDWTFDPRRQ